MAEAMDSVQVLAGLSYQAFPSRRWLAGLALGHSYGAGAALFSGVVCLMAGARDFSSSARGAAESHARLTDRHARYVPGRTVAGDIRRSTADKARTVARRCCCARSWRLERGWARSAETQEGVPSWPV